MAVYSYSRVTEIEGLQQGEDLDLVLDKEALQLQTFALSQGLRLDLRFVDQALKWNVEFRRRPQAIRLLQTLRAGDAIVASTLLRVFSSCEDLEQSVRQLRGMRVRLYITDLGGDLCSEQFTPPFARVMKAFSRLEKRRLTERIKSVKESQRREGKFLGGNRPFGYEVRDGGILVENPREQLVLRRILDLKRQGKSLRAISSAVSTEHMPISFKTVQRLLKRHAEEEVPA